LLQVEQGFGFCRRGGKTAFFVMIKDGGNNGIGIVEYGDQIQVGRVDGAVRQHGAFPPVDQSIPKARVEKNDGHAAGLAGLHQGDAFREFIEGTKAAGHDHIGGSVLHEHHLARIKMFEGEGDILIGVAVLFMRQFDVEADAVAGAAIGAAVGRLHDARTTATDHRKTSVGEFLGNAQGLLIPAVLLGQPRRAEDTDTGLNSGQLFVATHKLRHDLKDFPGFAGEATLAAVKKTFRVQGCAHCRPTVAAQIFRIMGESCRKVLLMTETPRILVDASSFLYRAFHALPDLRAPDGLPTGAIYGVVNMLRRLQREYPQGEIVVVFDAAGPTFRDAIYPEYKAQRPPMPQELRVQIEPLLQWIAAMGLPLLREAGVEADDVIGTLACATPADRPLLIISGDKDLAQLIDARTQIIDTMKNTMLDAQGVRDKFGVPPEQMVDYLALVGDKVDNIPGVPGAGPKTVAKWLGQYGTLDNLLAHADEIGGKVGDALRASRDFLPRSRDLARIRCDLELPAAELVRQPVNTAALLALAERLGFSSWRRELQSELAAAGDLAGFSPLPGDTIDRSRYRLIDTEDALQDLLARIAAAQRVAIDTETTSLNPHDAELVGISFAWQEGNEMQAAYLPLGHREGQQLPRPAVLAALRPWLESERAKLAQNAKFDWQIFWGQGIEPQGLLRDTLLESYVLDSNGPHDLDHLAERFLQHQNIAYEDVAGKGKKQRSFAEVPIREALPYAAEDADVCLRLDALLWPRIEREAGLRRVFAEIEMPLALVLARMEWAGVKIDRQQLEALSSELAAAMQQVEREAQELAGQPFNLSSPKQIQEILFDKMQLPSQKKTKGGQVSTDEDSLAQLASHSPLPGLILEYRSLAKLRNTYADALPQMIHPRTGRVHTHYRQAVAATGRLSSSDPNLQNIPVRTEQGRRIRAAFIAEPGHLLLSADYSQIELRLMAHFSHDEGLLAAFAAGEDVHRATAAEVFQIPLEDVDAEQRRAAKAINFGLIYGQTAFGLAQQLGVDQASARAYMQRYFERYPRVRAYMEESRKRAREQGFVETLYGRRLYVPEIQSRNPARRAYAERAAINAPLQGSAADLIKLAMIAVDTWLQEDRSRGRMILQVHDELILEVAEERLQEASQALRARMEGVAQLAVPLEVSVGWGASWAEAHS